MLRQAQPAPPLPCFGLEYEAEDPRCQTCPHVDGCTRTLGVLLNKIPLSKAVYSLMPPAFQSAPSSLLSIPHPALEGFFQEAHLLVYGAASPHNLHLHYYQVQHGARATKTSPFMFMVALMLSHQHTSPDKPFLPSKLEHSDAVSRVAVIRDACLHKFGHYDVRAIDGTLNETLGKTGLRQCLLADEKLAGTFITTFKITTGGPAAPPLFRALETKLSLNWLAIEPAYTLFLATKEAASAEVLAHRQRVQLRHGALKRHKSEAMALFQAREAIAAEAVRQVLSERQLEPKHLKMTNEPVTDMIKHWTRIGLCLQHRECLRALDGQPNAYGITRA